MKKLITVVCLLASAMVRGQCFSWGGLHFTVDFEDTCYHQFISIDTNVYRNNRWQVGKPDKVSFDSAFTLFNAMVTDTLDPYPANDTSVFTFKLPVRLPELCYSYHPPLNMISFFYKLDIDSNTFARIEVSTDSGLSWKNLNDSLPAGFLWNGPPVNLSTSTTEWKVFSVYTNPTFPVPWHDTVFFRFTFISDSLFANKDGWIIDNFNFWYLCEGGVATVANPNLITLYPNPSHGNLYFHTDKPHKEATITIYDMQGRQVYNSPSPANGYLNLQLPDGVYTLKYSDEEEYCVKQVVIAQ
jgi:hypothetical protein